MSIEVVRTTYECLNEGDFDRLGTLCDENIVCVLPEGGINTGIVKGRKAVLDFVSHYLEPFDDFRMRPDRFVEADDKVVSFVEMSGSGRGSGLEFKTRLAHVMSVGKEGLVTRIEVFTDGGKGALESVGLSSDA